MKLLAIAVLFIFLCAYGCGREKTISDGVKLVARINNYEMTTDDFTNEARLTIRNKYFSSDPEKAKEAILDEMITKKVLLEEAQRLSFDKDKAFMKEIERYWEQALLKLLIKAKTEELEPEVVVTEDEVKEEYERMSKEEDRLIKPFKKLASDIRQDIHNKKMREAFDKWITELRNKASIKVYKENLKEISID